METGRAAAQWLGANPDFEEELVRSFIAVVRWERWISAAFEYLDEQHRRSWAAWKRLTMRHLARTKVFENDALTYWYLRTGSIATVKAGKIQYQ